MATDVILPALGMSQDTGKIIQWLKSEGAHVAKGEALVEIETDKATVEIEAPVDGTLARVSAAAGTSVPVGQVIALILATNEALPRDGAAKKESPISQLSAVTTSRPSVVSSPEAAYPTRSPLPETGLHTVSTASMLAARVAADHNIDLSQVKATGRRIQKADVLAYLQNHEAPKTTTIPRLPMASPKARRLATEQGKDLATMKGSGPGGAVLAADVLAIITVNSTTTASEPNLAPTSVFVPPVEELKMRANGSSESGISNTWRTMAERTTQSWTSTPHFYLTREVNVSRLIQWREGLMQSDHMKPNDTSPITIKITYTDLLVRIVAAALHIHPRLNASWSEDTIILHPDIHVGLAVAIEDGLVVPIIHKADTLGLGDIAQKRVELVKKAQSGKLRLQDISGGTFTISNLGMFNVDAFNAIINQPQVAILAIGRIAERVVPVHGQPAIQPMMALTLTCDHRAVDGARGARFLNSIANFIEEPLKLLA